MAEQFPGAYSGYTLQVLFFPSNFMGICLVVTFLGSPPPTHLFYTIIMVRGYDHVIGCATGSLPTHPKLLI